MKNLWYLLFLTCVSCETVVEVDSPDYDSEPVVTSFFSSDSTWSVIMHKSLGASARVNILEEYISDASIKIMDGSNMVDHLSYQGLGRYVSNTGRLPTNGIKYTLVVEFPNQPTIQATSEAPLPVQITDYSIEPLAPSLDIPDAEYNRSKYKFRISFSDMIGANYYRIAVYRFVSNRYGLEENDPDSVYRQIWMDESSPGWSCGYSEDVEVDIDPVNGSGTVGGESDCAEEFVVTDRLFDGKNYSWTATTLDLSRGSGRNELLVIISSLSEDYYEYLLSLERNEFYDPLTQEPIPVYSNVTGGLGVFAGYTNTTLVFPIFQDN